MDDQHLDVSSQREVKKLLLHHLVKPKEFNLPFFLFFLLLPLLHPPSSDERDKTLTHGFETPSHHKRTLRYDKRYLNHRIYKMSGVLRICVKQTSGDLLVLRQRRRSPVCTLHILNQHIILHAGKVEHVNRNTGSSITFIQIIHVRLVEIVSESIFFKVSYCICFIWKGIV